MSTKSTEYGTLEGLSAEQAKRLCLLKTRWKRRLRDFFAGVPGASVSSDEIDQIAEQFVKLDGGAPAIESPLASLIKGENLVRADLPGAKMTVEEFERARANLKKAEPDKDAQTLVSMPMGRLEAAIAKGLEQHLRRCDECGWSGVVLEHIPTLPDLDAFGDNGVCYCPECGEDFHENAD